MSTITEQIKRLEERVATFKTILETLQADLTPTQARYPLASLEQLLSQVEKDDAASKAIAQLNAQLKAKEDELQRREGEVREKELTGLRLTVTDVHSMSNGLQEIQSTSKEIQSAMQSLQSSSKTAGSQLEALERLASGLAQTAAADTRALQSQHKQEVDGLKSTIYKLGTKLSTWESGHKDRLADFDAKRQAAIAEIEQREQSLAKRKEELMSLEIEALRDLRAAGDAAKYVEARKQVALEAMDDLEKRLEKWRIDIEDGIDSLDDWGQAYKLARTVTQEQTTRAQEICRELHSDIERFDGQIKSMEVRRGKLPEPRADVSLSDDEGLFEERLTQPSTGKRVHQASSTSTGASPRKTVAKRAKATEFPPRNSSPRAETPPRPPPSFSLATRGPVKSTTRTLQGNGSRIGQSFLSMAPHDYSTATLASRLPQRRPVLGSDAIEPPAGQASSSSTRQSTSAPSGQGQAQGTTSPAATEALAPQTRTQEDLPPLEWESEWESERESEWESEQESEQESEVGPEVQEEEEEEVPEPSSAQSQIEVHQKIKLIWSQLIFTSKVTREERTDVMDWMYKAEVKVKHAARASYSLEKCAREEGQGRVTCFTSCLRGKGRKNFLQGTTERCNECRKAKIHVPCLRVTWVNDQARTQEDSAKRWIVDKR
ncbi:MAG: hypothetical protein Q9193_000349 [Seirophora villosa]